MARFASLLRLLALSALVGACGARSLMTPHVDPPVPYSGSEAPSRPPLAMLSVWSESRAVALWLCPVCTSVRFVPNESVDSWARAGFDGPGVIEYSPTQIFDVYQREGRAAVLGIIAHEWGHIVLRTSSQVLADAWAGCTMRVLHVDPQPFVDFLGRVHDVHEREDFHLRAYATQGGWSRCDAPEGVSAAFAEHLPPASFGR